MYSSVLWKLEKGQVAATEGERGGIRTEQRRGKLTYGCYRTQDDYRV